MGEYKTLEEHGGVTRVSCAQTQKGEDNLSCWLNKDGNMDKVEFPRYIDISGANQIHGNNKNEPKSEGGLNSQSSFIAKFDYGYCKVQERANRRGVDPKRRLVCNGY